MKLLSKTPMSKSYLQLNYILPKLSYQLSRSCIKEQNKHFQIYCTHCYVKNTFILESLLTTTKKKLDNLTLKKKVKVLE